MTVVLFICWAMITYLACQLAYRQGRKEKWEEMCKDYICIHKTTCVRVGEKKRPKTPKTLDKLSKKR